MLRPAFDPQAEFFTLHNAQALGLAAEVAYEAPEAAEATARARLGCRQFVFLDEEDTQAFVSSNREATIVAFRGTEKNVADWLTDADASLVSGPLDGRVHEGFYDSLSDVWHALDRTITRLDPHGDKPLWLTGHSLGGALATLATARWIDRGRPIAGMYSFGQPRTGDRVFARNFDFAMKSSAFRFVNDNDLVSRVPPRAMGYRHVGTFKYFTDGGLFAEGVSWWRAFLDRWTFRLEDFFDGQLEGFADHSMKQYNHHIATAISAGLRLVGAAPVRTPRPVRPRRRAA